MVLSKRSSTTIDLDRVKELRNRGYGTNKIVRVMHVDKETLLQLMTREGLHRPPTHKSTPDFVDDITKAMTEMYQNGTSLEKISKTYSMATETVRKRLTNVGVTIRHAGRYKNKPAGFIHPDITSPDLDIPVLQPPSPIPADAEPVTDTHQQPPAEPIPATQSTSDETDTEYSKRKVREIAIMEEVGAQFLDFLAEKNLYDTDGYISNQKIEEHFSKWIGIKYENLESESCGVDPRGYSRVKGMGEYNKHWTQTDNKSLKDMYASGIPIPQIASRLNRTTGAVKYQLKKLDLFNANRPE